ncbi:MAG: hypothetical protein OQL28_13710 [Sedimenticola sp.]|nr:hypothetical protein [Sedimenticola sp.]
MFRSIVLGSTLSLLLSAPALASHCPLDAKAIDGALQRADLSEMQKSEIMTLRDQGMSLHNSGDHRQAEQTLAKAMRMLLDATGM